MHELFMCLGFLLAAYSVIANDVIQTLGTFLSSNKRVSWWKLWGYAGAILTVILVYGWHVNGGDVSYGRLIGDAAEGFDISNPRYPHPNPMVWWYVLPPAVLLCITRLGIPVSTTFMILTFFAPGNLGPMLIKSVSGYAVAFLAAIIGYLFIAKSIEKHFLDHPLERSPASKRWWTLAQWSATGFLWSQWLIQDFANIYVYLPRKLGLPELVLSLVVLLGLLAYIFYQRGGAIQKIVLSKRNTTDIRSATIIDLLFGLILLFFKEISSIPMSTTWVFIGLLAGREYALTMRIDKKVSGKIHRMISFDFGKVSLGLVVSVALVYILKFLQG